VSHYPTPPAIPRNPPQSNAPDPLWQSDSPSPPYPAAVPYLPITQPLPPLVPPNVLPRPRLAQCMTKHFRQVNDYPSNKSISTRQAAMQRAVHHLDQKPSFTLASNPGPPWHDHLIFYEDSRTIRWMPNWPTVLKALEIQSLHYNPSRPIQIIRKNELPASFFGGILIQTLLAAKPNVPHRVNSSGNGVLFIAVVTGLSASSYSARTANGDKNDAKGCARRCPFPLKSQH